MDLYCTEGSKIGLIGSAFFAGTFVGSFFLPRLSDVYGRKPIHLLGLMIFVAVVFSSFFMKSIGMSYFLLFMGGISEAGRYYVAYIWCVEFFPRRAQTKVGLAIFTVFGISMTLIGLRFWFVAPRVWTWNAYVSIVLALFSFTMCALWTPESPRFLHSHQLYDEAGTVMQQINKTNKKEKGAEFRFTSDEDASSQIELTGTLRELWGNRKLRCNLLIMMVEWSYSSFAFFVVPFYIAKVDGNMYLFSICTAVAELFSVVICLVVINKKYDLT